MRARALALVALVSLGLAGPVLGQELVSLELGGGCSVRQISTMASCWGAAVPCVVWEPSGFSFGGLAPLQQARAFGRVPETGRILASIAAPPAWVPPPAWAPSVGLLYTDDLGATWNAVAWRWPAIPRVLSFEPTGLRGVAAGDGGYVWTTEDGGTTWRDHGGSSGVRYLDALRLDRVLVLVDEHGTAWRSRDGGFARDTLVEGVTGRLRYEDGAIAVPTARGPVLVRQDGSVRTP